MNHQPPFPTPLSAEQRKKWDEIFALLVLKHCFPERYATLFLSDAPDLQMPDGSAAIEVTTAVRKNEAIIDGEFVKLRFGQKTPEERRQCREKILHCGGKIKEIPLGTRTGALRLLYYPSVDERGEEAVYREAIQRKLGKISAYRQKGFAWMGLFLLPKSISIPPEIGAWIDCFEQAVNGYEDCFDTLYFCYETALLCYDYRSKTYSVRKIAPADYEAMKRQAVAEAENRY